MTPLSPFSVDFPVLKDGRLLVNRAPNRVCISLVVMPLVKFDASDSVLSSLIRD